MTLSWYEQTGGFDGDMVVSRQVSESKKLQKSVEESL